MPRETAEGPRWICRPGRPTAVVLLLAAALLVVNSIIAVVDLLSPQPPSVQHGPFGDGHALFGAGLLVALFVVAGLWAARGLSARALSRTLLVLIAAGPAGWGLALLDSLGRDWINSAGAASPLIAMALLVVAPLVTVVGAIAAVAEIIRATFATRPA